MLRIGMLSYSNALPLCYGLTQDPELSLHYDTPQHLYHGLLNHSLEYALTSSIHLTDPSLISLPQYCIAATGEVLSVILYHKIPLKKLSGKTIAISSETATSFALLKILCKELWHITPHFTLLTSGQSITTFDAALLIGDEALQQQEGFMKCDLGSAWYELTALPFVFALFFSPKHLLPSSSFEAKIAHSLSTGMQLIPYFSNKVALEKNLPFSLVKTYYQKLHYVLGPKEKEGLTQFVRLYAEENI
jgi:chorismate dehydratase